MHKGFSRFFLAFSLAMVAVMVAAAVAAPVIAPFDPNLQKLDQRFVHPGEKGLILGSDDLGRDILSRVLYGARPALMVGLVAVSVALGIGLLVGLSAGLAEGRVDTILMLLMDCLLSFPTILLAITVVTFLGYGLWQVILAVGVIYSPVFARLIRAETLAVKAEGYVESSRALGSSLFKTIWLHILPNLAGKVVVQCSITMSLAVVVESSLSYLGLGVQPPNPSWGLMLQSAKNYMMIAPWMVLAPGAAIALTVLAFNILGDELADRFNPKM